MKSNQILLMVLSLVFSTQILNAQQNPCLQWPPVNGDVVYANPGCPALTRVDYCINDEVLVRTVVPREGEARLRTGRISSIDHQRARITVNYGHTGTWGFRSSSITVAMYQQPEAIFRFRRYYRSLDSGQAPLGPELYPIYSREAVTYCLHGNQADGTGMQLQNRSMGGQADRGFLGCTRDQRRAGEVSGVFENMYTPRVADAPVPAGCPRTLPIYAIVPNGAAEGVFHFAVGVELVNERYRTPADPRAVEVLNGERFSHVRSEFAQNFASWFWQDSAPQPSAVPVAAVRAVSVGTSAPAVASAPSHPLPNPSQSVSQAPPTPVLVPPPARPVAVRHAAPLPVRPQPQTIVPPTAFTADMVSSWIAAEAARANRLRTMRWYFNQSFEQTLALRTLIGTLSNQPATSATMNSCLELCKRREDCTGFQIYPTGAAPGRISCAFHNLSAEDFASAVPYQRPSSVSAGFTQVLFVDQVAMSRPGGRNHNAVTLKSLTTAQDMVAWFAADSMNAADGSSVSIWPDLSGNNTHVQQTTAAQRPTYISNAVNSLPALRFDNTQAQHLSTLSAVADIAGNDDSSLTWILVLRPSSSQHRYTNLIDYSHGATNPVIEMYDDNINQFCFYGGACATLTADTFQVLTFVYNGTGEQAWVNGVSQGTSHNVITWTADSQRLGIGTWMGNSERTYNGDIAEIIMYRAALSPTSRAAVECYLSHKYRLGVAGC